MKIDRGQGINRPQRPATEQRFSFYQGRTPRLDFHATRQKKTSTFLLSVY